MKTLEQKTHNKEYMREYRKTHPTDWKRHYEKYKEGCKQRAIEYYQNHKYKTKINVKKWAQVHPEKCREYNKKWREKNREKERLRSREYYKTHPDKVYASTKKYNGKIRIEIFALLGNKCANPFNIDHSLFEKTPDYIHCLQIDHVNGDGWKDRMRFGNHHRSQYLFIYKQIKAGSKDYQLLCANCNWIKRYRGNEI